MKPIELVIQALDFDSLDKLTMADALIVGEKEYGLRLPHYYTHDEIIRAIEKIKKRSQRVYVAINSIFHEPELARLERYLVEMKDYPIDGFIFGDLAVYQIAKSFHFVDRLIYNPETYITNYMSVRFFKEKGIKRVALAKEITLEDIIKIGRETDMELEVLVHGAVNMFHSKRRLVTNYLRFIGSNDPERFQGVPLYLEEDKRKGILYPILEDHHGTHIYRETDLCALLYLDRLVESGIQAFRIDGNFKTLPELVAIATVYREAIDDLMEGKFEAMKEQRLEALKAIPGIRPFDTGFLFNKTVYKG